MIDNKPAELNSLSWGPDGRMLALGWSNGMINFMSSERPKGEDSSPLLKLADDQGTVFLCGDKDGNKKSARHLRASLKGVTALTFSERDEEKNGVNKRTAVLVSGGSDMDVRCFRVTLNADGTVNATLIFKYKHDEEVSCVSLAHNSSLLATGSTDGLFKLGNIGDVNGARCCL